MYDRLTRVVATVGSGLGDLIFSGWLIDFKTAGDNDADGEQVCSGTFTTFEQTMRALKIVKETQNIFEINTHSNIADSIEPS